MPVEINMQKSIQQRPLCCRRKDSPIFYHQNNDVFTIPSLGNPITHIKQENDLNFHLMKMIEAIKEEINELLKDIHENKIKQAEALKGETNKSLKEIHGNINKQVKEMNKIVQDLNMEIEAIKKTQKEAALEMENPGQRSGTANASIPNIIQ
jgi:chromosome condensin MukBEF complex kleisin-like MukF subunit